MHPINVVRASEGAWATLLEKFRVLFPDKHRQCLRMDKACFNEILSYVQGDITKEDTNVRRAIEPDQRLAVTLMYLATG